MVSVIVPMCNSSAFIEGCLTALSGQTVKDFEVILVDDCSLDDTVQKAQKYPFKIIRLEERLSPAQVRNYGAKNSSGAILLFVDADIILKPDSVGEITSRMALPDTDVLFGAYSEYTPVPDFFSQIQNLILVYRGSKLPEVTNITLSFFCAIKRDVFKAVGGYNEKMLYYEDVDIGNRLTRKGFRCRFDPGLKVTHQKKYTHSSLMRDYFKKAEAMAGYLKDKNFTAELRNNGWPLSLKAASISSLGLLFSLVLIKLSIAPFLFFLSAYFIFSAPLLWYLFRQRNLFFALRSVFILFEIFIAAFTGIGSAILRKDKKADL